MEKNIFAPINPGEKHIAVALVVDISLSMMGRPIEELNNGLKSFGQALQEDLLALGRADITIISFSSTVQTELEFKPATEYLAPHLSISGLTVLNEAIDTALDALEIRKKVYKEYGIDYYRPWLFVLTDGKASDNEKEISTKTKLRDYINRGKVTFFPMGIGEGADINKLRDYYPENAASKPVLSADKDNFKEAFVWLSNSLIELMQSARTGTEIVLPTVPPTLTVEV